MSGPMSLKYSEIESFIKVTNSFLEPRDIESILKIDEIYLETLLNE